jgi:hypothetical protein
VAASSAALEGRRPGWQLGRSSFEVQLAMLCIASFTPQDDGMASLDLFVYDPISLFMEPPECERLA